MTDSPDDYKFAFDIKQDAVITHPEPKGVIIAGESFDIPAQTVVQPVDLVKNLIANLWRQVVQISDR